MKINLKGYFQVVEYNLAKEILYRAGCSQRREDADTLLVFDRKDASGSFYYSKNNAWSPIARLMIDEGSYSDALHSREYASGALLTTETTISFSAPWMEYVDACELLCALHRKLNSEFPIKGTQLIGSGSRQRHYMEQYTTSLLDWSRKNPKHILQFVEVS